MIDFLNLGSDEKSTFAGSEFQTLTIRSVKKLRRFWFSHCASYCSDAAERWSTKLCTMFGRLLLAWYTICIFGVLALTEFCQVQNSLCVQVLRSPILAALLHGTRAASVSQTLQRGTPYKESNYRTFAEGATYIRMGGHRVWHRPTF